VNVRLVDCCRLSREVRSSQLKDSTLSSSCLPSFLLSLPLSPETTPCRQQPANMDRPSLHRRVDEGRTGYQAGSSSSQLRAVDGLLAEPAPARQNARDARHTHDYRGPAPAPAPPLYVYPTPFQQSHGAYPHAPATIVPGAPSSWITSRPDAVAQPQSAYPDLNLHARGIPPGMLHQDTGFHRHGAQQGIVQRSGYLRSGDFLPGQPRLSPQGLQNHDVRSETHQQSFGGRVAARAPQRLSPLQGWHNVPEELAQEITEQAYVQSLLEDLAPTPEVRLKVTATHGENAMGPSIGNHNEHQPAGRPLEPGSGSGSTKNTFGGLARLYDGVSAQAQYRMEDLAHSPPPESLPSRRPSPVKQGRCKCHSRKPRVDGHSKRMK
jgi:hypothetical protein